MLQRMHFLRLHAGLTVAAGLIDGHSHSDLQVIEEKAEAGRFTCDNGRIQRPDSPQFAPWSKQSRFEMGLRGPVMIRWRGPRKPRRGEHTLVSNTDLPPAVLAAVGISPQPAMRGIDLMNSAKREAIFVAAYNPVANQR